MSERIINIIVSGGFDNLHGGHMKYIKQADSIATHLIILLNSDKWLLEKKGFFFMPYVERRKLLHEIFPNAEIISTDNTAESLKSYISLKNYIYIFAKGGEYDMFNLPKEESRICRENNIGLIFGIGGYGKQYSSRLSANNVINAWKNNKIPMNYFFDEEAKK